MAREIVFVFVVTSLFYFTVAVPEAGIKEMSFNKDLQFHGFHKSLFSGGNIYISGESSNISQTNPLIVEWTLFFSECAQAYAGLQDKKLRDLPQDFFDIHVVDSGMQSISGNGPFYLIESVHEKETVYKFPKSNVSKSKAQKNTSPKNTSPKNTSPKNTPPKKTSPKNTPPKNTSPKNTPPKKTPPKNTSPKNTSPKDTSPKNTPPENTPQKNTSPKNTSPKNTPPKKIPPKNTSPKNTPPKTTLQLKRKRENRANENEKHRTEERSSPSHLNDKRIKRAAENHAKLQEDTSAATNPRQSLTNKLKKKLPTTAKSGHVMKGYSQSGRVTTVGKDGNYLLRVKVSRQRAPKSEYKVQITVQIKSDKYGFLSAAEWPLLPFYGVMSLVYLAYGVVWLIVSACQWRELLRIQFWIGGVIALGMLEKAVLFSEYNNVNNTGVPGQVRTRLYAYAATVNQALGCLMTYAAHGLVVFGLVISCIKRTLSRILIIIVSLGFGIVKPRLGAALHRVLAVGLLYFILCVIEGGYREKALKADVENKQLIAAIPLSILDAVICWWIFMSLMQTMRTLRIRKNIVKLSLYRHFTNILVFSVIASVAFMVWSIKSYHLNACIKDWKELWIDEAFWHFLFAIVLLAIMVLWRPTANNQRYAFTPLIDVGEDDDDDMTLSDAFNGMKMRNKSEGDVANRADKHKSKLEDDLRWVEENIPTAGGIDTALPTLLDSDEEVMTTKLEMSKME